MTEGAPSPGETGRRTLARPPGDRYRRVETAAEVDLPAVPNLVRALAFGFAVAAGIALLFAVIVGILDLGIGLLALSILGGWGIGTAVHRGAWRGRRQIPGKVVPGVAAGLSAGAWLAGYFGAYLFSLLLRPDSSLTFAERLAQSSFGDWLGPQFGPLQIFEVLLIVGVAWYSAQSRSSAS